MGIQVIGHTSFLGHTGYNNHSRNFFTHLNNYLPVRIRNYTYCSDLSYLKPEEYNLLIEQKWDGPQKTIGRPFVKNLNDLLVNIVLNESHHYYFYDNYSQPMIAYNVWESTRQLKQYFDRILQYDQFWCPTEWQRLCTIQQGYPEDRVRVVPEGVSPHFLPGVSAIEKKQLYTKYQIPDDAFVFMIFGRWDYRKSTTEMIQAWFNTFKDKDKCYLILSVDNPFPTDGMKTTEERLTHYKLNHERIKVLHFPARDEYIKWLQYGACLLACSRSEGWNLPLMEALACGTPSICSDWGGHLEFADGIAYKVNVPNELPPKHVFMLGDDHDFGVWGEPDFNHLEYVMNEVYNSYTDAKIKTLSLSKYLRNLYTWDNAAKIADKHIKELVTKKYHTVSNNTQTPTVSFVTSFYNSEKYITDLAISVLNQTIQDWEWIVTDDFSTDSTKGRVLNLCKKDPRIKYVEQKSKQEVYWNPHKFASGQYIVPIDSDDQLVPKTAEVLIHFFDGNPHISCIHTSANYYYQNFDITSFKNSSFCKFEDETIMDKHKKYLDNDSGYERVGYMFGAIRAYRNPGPDFNFNDGDYQLGRHEDLIKLLRLEEVGYPLYLNRTLYKVRMREDSNSGSWGDKGGITEFPKIYETATNRRQMVFKHIKSYDDVREKLYCFLNSDLNEQKERKTILCLGFELSDIEQQMVKDIYFDHKLIFDNLECNPDYIFVIVNESTNIKKLLDDLNRFQKTKVNLFMINHDWDPSFYDLEDASSYFKLFTNVKNEIQTVIPFRYGVYLYKYCFIEFETKEKEKIKLNLGCGNDIRPGYINIDRYNNTGLVDLKCDISCLPFKHGSVDEIFNAHVFEHIPINEVYGTLEEWERVLKIDGKLIMRLPNLENEVKIWLNAPDDRKWFEVHRIFGSQSHEGNTHLNGHNPESLKWLLERFNFKVTKLGVGNSGFGDEIQLEAKRIQGVTNKSIQCITHFVDGPFAEVKGDPNDKGFYLFDFLDPEHGSSVHQQMLGINTWTRPHRKYFTNWLVRTYRNSKLINEHQFNLKGKNVLISFDSKSLGDSIAWVPQVEEFRKKHECITFVSTFWNKLFEKSYPHIRFIPPGQELKNLYASYTIGCFDNNLFKNRVEWRQVPLQRICSDILGLEYREILCNIGIAPGPRPIKEKYVAISEFSTFQCKFWMYPNGWQDIVDHLNELGYKVMSISKEETNLKNVIKMNNRPIEETITNIYHAEFFVGISSGPSWLAWALKKPVVLISGYSTAWAEFESNIQRVINLDVCHGCFNDSSQKFERGDWNWCPRHKGTDRQFECTKNITPDQVKKAIKKIIDTYIEKPKGFYIKNKI